MTYSSLLLRLLLIVALSLNGYASAAMSVGGGHAMFMAKAAAVVAPQAGPSDMAMESDCHDGVDMAMAHPAAADPAPQPAPAGHDEDCCGKFRCQCDCLQAMAIVRIDLPMPPPLHHAALASPRQADAPKGVSSLPLRPPIA
ncbi:CopL family metal-binding regulatory protein [Lysobacter sp. CA199]|uniref:CopL family metal-binding regulatory protein n=1 Tax=Lysobacter sp. CA199 TaxID=3455608 RepID=UPI003F8D8DB9